MPSSYSPEYRELVLEQVRSGRLASVLAVELEVSETTIHRWKAQDEIDSGTSVGVSSTEKADLPRRRSWRPVVPGSANLRLS